VRECETGINMWHPSDDQSAAADMTTKWAPDSVADWVAASMPHTLTRTASE